MAGHHGIRISRNRTTGLFRQLPRMAQGGGTQFLKSRGIKIHIRQGAEQGLGRKVVHGAVGNALCARTQGDIRQFAQLRHKGVLHFSNVSLLATNAHLFTALASTGLLALIAEHMEILRIIRCTRRDTSMRDKFPLP